MMIDMLDINACVQKTLLDVTIMSSILSELKSFLDGVPAHHIVDGGDPQG